MEENKNDTNMKKTKIKDKNKKIKQYKNMKIKWYKDEKIKWYKDKK